MLVSRSLGMILMLAQGCVFAPLAHASDQNEDRLKLSGSLEHYYWNSSHDGVDHLGQRARWLSLTLDLPGSASLVAGHFSVNQLEMLDEFYLDLGSGLQHLKFGRIRPAFGFADWNEWYTGLISAPYARRAKFSNFTSLQSFASGVEVSGGTPDLQYKAALLDGTLHPYQIAPQSLDRFEGRLQAYRWGVIFGLNGLWQLDGRSTHPTRLLGFDAWWTAPQVQVRGEFIKDCTYHATAEGHHVDIFFKPYGWVNTSLVGRAQSATGNGAQNVRTEFYTLGLKHELNEQLCLDLNYGFGPDGPQSKSDRGWRFQLRTNFRF